VAPATSGGATTATTSSPATAGSTTPATSTSSGIGAYGQGGIIAELKALVQDLSNSQVVGSTGSSSTVPPVLAKLNSAFQKLISDLNGTSSAASSTSAGGSAAGASDAASQSTAALQSFLTNFAQDLQNNGANSLGSSVNTTA
jgi:hypothetical protein